MLVLVGVLTWVLVAPGDDEDEPYVAPVPTETPAGIDPAGAAEALQRLVSALTGGERTAATELAAPEDTTTAARLGDLVDTAVAARLTDVTLRYIDDDGGLAADGTWAAVVDATWAYAGFDPEPNATEVSVRFRGTDDGVAIAGIGGGTLRTPVWMTGPVQVDRSSDLLVVAASGTDLAAYVRLARAAVPTVSSVVTSWRPRLVVEVPADGAALEAALGVEPGYYGQIAAVTGAAGTVVPGAPVHVFVNPDVFSGLGRAGREVVLAHEATHVATDAPSSEGPTWLTEGFADYVALRETTLPLTRTAGQVAQQVRDDGLPQALPTAADFDTRGPHLGAVYESSWLISVTLADRGDAARLEDFYTAVSAGTPVDEALRRDFDWSEADLVRAWRARLAALPGA
ncbi:hypothetical protein [Nocardioides sp.]|uniref:hypothetical protein n=1 Tax=Nocardioides sp. TaxID=35761 RepID=UPI00271A324B|nr:hypothetical protein [Nocardioides sp.]MDO9458450.1 hypothetical protein [Nocardioides sp.]